MLSVQPVTGFFAQDRFGLTHERVAGLAGLSLAAVGLAPMTSQLVVQRVGWPPARYVALGAVLWGHAASPRPRCRRNPTQDTDK